MFTLVSRVTRALLGDPSLASHDAEAAPNAPPEGGHASGAGMRGGRGGASGRDRLADVQRDLNDFNSALPPQLRFETVSFRMYAEVGQGAAFALMHVSAPVTGMRRVCAVRGRG
jgi:hypothetical protein